ncbi:MAG: phenylalanine--tRNA ligase subunit alpha [bacterium]
MTLLDEVAQILHEAQERIGGADSLAALKELQVSYLGRKGSLTAVLKQLKDLPPDQKKEIGAAANKARVRLEQAFEQAADSFSGDSDAGIFDPTLPGTYPYQGVTHIVNQTINQICRIFQHMGFEIAYGPDIETDYYNFEALNFEPDHPAREMQDTLFVEGGRLLRTHTTPVQARVLEAGQPPLKVITPGKCFRNESISTRGHMAFHQVDGFLVDEGVTVADLKGTMVAFCKAFFGEDLKLKFRPSYFPFTEPSAEIDIQCLLCRGKGCRVCKQSGWLEILGCGMIDPNVLQKAGIDSERYTGFAFGTGVERPAMLKHRIDDIRLFFNNDVRLLRQFV